MPQAKWRTSLPIAVCCLVALLGSSACSDREETYRQAVEDLTEANAEREAAQQALQSTEAELAATRSQLQRAEQEMKSAREEVAEARQAVVTSADDIVLFRAIQSKLLRDDTLEDAAISVVVRDKVATLRGLASERQAAYAEQLAVSQPGITSVRNRIVLMSSESGDAGTRKQEDN